MRRVVVPLAMPGVQSGAILVFVLAASSYVTPVVLGGSRVKLMTPMVVQQLAETFLWPFGAALAHRPGGDRRRSACSSGRARRSA